MIGRKKPIQIMLDNEEHWSLSRYAAIQKKAIRQVVRDHMKSLFDELKEKYPRKSISESSLSKDDTE